MGNAPQPAPRPAEKIGLTAFRLPGRRSMQIEPAPAGREWMDVTTKGWANRCLPLKIANQSGWVILNDCEFEAVWGGQAGLDSTKILTKGGAKASAVSLFGYGVLTWSIPYIFRTSPGHNLYVRGPSNSSKDFAVPFDAVVETDWLPYPFTMNWRITKPFKTIRFEKNEAICLIMPVKRGELELVTPEIRNLESAPELAEGYRLWHESRMAAMEAAVHAGKSENTPNAAAGPKQGHYIRGVGYLGETVDDSHAPGHQTKLALAQFAEMEPPTVRAAEPSQLDVPGNQSKRWWSRWFGK